METKSKMVSVKTTVLSLIFMFLFQGLCFAGTASIYDAWVTPEYPTNIDNVNISILGEAARSGGHVSSAVFNSTDLILDLYIDMGNYDVVSYWSHNEPIGTLPPDDYTLSVRVYDYHDNTVQDECTIEFTVTPEPATLFFFSGGILAIRIFLRKK